VLTIEHGTRTTRAMISRGNRGKSLSEFMLLVRASFGDPFGFLRKPSDRFALRKSNQHAVFLGLTEPEAFLLRGRHSHHRRDARWEVGLRHPAQQPPLVAQGLLCETCAKG
jgi:hypothetical protein